MAAKTYTELLTLARSTAGIDAAQLEKINGLLGMFPESVLAGMLSDLIKIAVKESTNVDHIAKFTGMELVPAIMTGKGSSATVKVPARNALDLLREAQQRLDLLVPHIKAYNEQNSSKLRLTVSDEFTLALEIPAKREINKVDRSWAEAEKLLIAHGVESLYLPTFSESADKCVKLAYSYKCDSDGKMLVQTGTDALPVWEPINKAGKRLSRWLSFGTWEQTAVRVDGKFISLDAWLDSTTAVKIESSEQPAAE